MMKDSCSANIKSPNDGLMFDQRLRRWPNIRPSLSSQPVWWEGSRIVKTPNGSKPLPLTTTRASSRVDTQVGQSAAAVAGTQNTCFVRAKFSQKSRHKMDGHDQPANVVKTRHPLKVGTMLDQSHAVQTQIHL